MERRSHQLLSAAYDSGIRYFDVARSYGLAEKFLASWLKSRGLRRGEVTIGSKWGYTYTGGWRMDAEVQEVKDHSLEALRRQLRETREILGEWLDLYQIHSATLESGVLEDRGVLSELASMRHDGLVIGLTVSGAAQAQVIRRALQVEAAGENPFQSVQATWNLLEPSAGPALADAHAAGWGVIIKEALANGRLARQNAATETDILEEVARAHQAGMDAVAIVAALANPWADVVLSGAATVEQLKSNLLGFSLKLSTDELARLAEPAEDYWATRRSLGWT
jgi:aryl-alcohol dehydrogenase-like predicted oxidoreductase